MKRLLQALLGDVQAQTDLAFSNWDAPPEQRNRKRALYWAQRAARNGSRPAESLRQLILFDPATPEIATRELHAMFEASAATGDAAGQYSLGWCYEQGVGVPKDLQKALHWYTIAATNGDEEAQQAVGRLCRQPPAN